MESESDEENIIEQNKEINDEENNELNEELIKMIENEDMGIISNKNIFTKQENEFMDKFIYLKNLENLGGEKINIKYIDDIFKSGNKSNPFYPVLNLNIKNSLISEEKKLNKFIKSDLDTQKYTGDLSQYKSEEFATNKRLSILENGVAQYSNSYNWSNKKKPTNGYTLTREMKDKKYFEENMDFQLNYPIDLKEVLITFSENIKYTDVIPEIYLECGVDYNKMDICVKLERLKDEQYNERSVIAYGFNFYSHKPEILKNDDNYIENYINQIIKCNAQYFRFIVRRPIILSNKNTHVSDLNINKLLIGINCISLTGVKLTDTNKVIEYISDIGKNISIKLISMIFTSEFIETLRYIAQDKSIFENIKKI